MATESAGAKTVYFIRHGESLYNEFKAKPSTWFTCRFWCCCDPGFYDPCLSAKGRAQVSVLHEQVRKHQLHEQVQYAFVSPLTRAIDTALGGFEGADLAMGVTPLIAEVLDTRGDIGRQPVELAQDYPQLDFGRLPRDWWYHDPDKGPAIPMSEPKSNIKRRQEEFMRALLARPEATIAVVGHSTFIRLLTNSRRKLPNCGILKATVSAEGVISDKQVLR